MTKTSTEAAIAKIFEVYGCRFGQFISLIEIREASGLTPEEIKDAVTVLFAEDETFRAEPLAFE